MNHSKRLKVICIILAAIALFAAAFYGWKAYRDTHPESYGAFQPYAPTVIVDGLRLTDRTLEVWENHPLLWFSPSTIVVRLDLNRDNSYITETKNPGLGDLFCDAQGTHCENVTTPAGQTYTIRQTFLADKKSPETYTIPSTEEAIYNLHGVRIAIQIKADSATRITHEDWSAMIDSFEPTTFTDLKVKHMHPGP